MNSKQVVVSVGAVLAVGSIVGIGLWLKAEPDQMIETRLTDVASETAAGTMGNSDERGEPDNIEGSFLRLAEAPPAESSAWPRFRGADSSNIVTGGVQLADAWGDAGPRVVWGMDLSEGHAGAAIYEGRVYMLDYLEEEKADALRCFSLLDGTEYWRRWYSSPTKRNHGISRTIPAITDDFIVSIGPRCHVMCVDTDTGDFRWGIDLVNEYGTEIPLWYTGQCPIIEDGIAVIAPAGDVLMMGVDCATGEVVWSTPNPDEWRMAHSSIIPMTIGGRRQYVYCAIGGIVSVSAEKEDLGEVLWSASAWTHSVTSPSPIAIDDDRLFLTAGYGGGSMVLGVTRNEGIFTAEPLLVLDKKIFGCEQQTPVLFEGHIFGILPKDSAAMRGQFVCLTPEGEVAWASGKGERFGLGPYLFADEKIFILDDTGELTMLRATLDGYEQLGRADVLEGHDAWAPMAMADGLLLLRDSERLICLDLTADGAGG